MQTLINQIQAAIEEQQYAAYGLRVTDGENIQAGDTLNNSRVWDNNEPLLDEDGDFVFIDGTCVIGLQDMYGETSEAIIARAIELTNVYIGNQIVFVGGEQGSSSFFMDEGEAIIHNAVAITTFEMA